MQILCHFGGPSRNPADTSFAALFEVLESAKTIAFAEAELWFYAMRGEIRQLCTGLTQAIPGQLPNVFRDFYWPFLKCSGTVNVAFFPQMVNIMMGSTSGCMGL